MKVKIPCGIYFERLKVAKYYRSVGEQPFVAGRLQLVAAQYSLQNTRMCHSGACASQMTPCARLHATEAIGLKSVILRRHVRRKTPACGKIHRLLIVICGDMRVTNDTLREAVCDRSRRLPSMPPRENCSHGWATPIRALLAEMDAVHFRDSRRHEHFVNP